MEKSKICTKCNKDLPISDYYSINNKRQNKVYTYNYCKKCHYSKMTKKTSKKWRGENVEQWKQLSKANGTRWRGKLKGGVYIVVTNKGLYVGSSGQLRLRLAQHKRPYSKESVLWHHNAKYITSFVISESDDEQTRLDIEKYWIKLLQPALNKQWKK